MHELSITQGIFDLVIDEANKAGARKVQKINLVVGEMSGIVDDCVEFYFEILSKDSIAEGAVLSFQKVPIKAHCRDCGREFTLKEFDWACPYCQSDGIEITAGKELFVESIEVE